MLFAIHCRDAAGSAGPRQDKLAEHLAHIETVIDAIRIAGPLLDKDGENVIGSLLVIEVEDMAAAEVFIESDPYWAAGVWESIDIDPFVGAAGSWAGGVTW